MAHVPLASEMLCSTLPQRFWLNVSGGSMPDCVAVHRYRWFLHCRRPCILDIRCGLHLFRISRSFCQLLVSLNVLESVRLWQVEVFNHSFVLSRQETSRGWRRSLSNMRNQRGEIGAFYYTVPFLPPFLLHRFRMQTQPWRAELPCSHIPPVDVCGVLILGQASSIDE